MFWNFRSTLTFVMALSTAQFLAILLSSVILHYPESIDETLKPRDTPQCEVLPEYDFVIVGAGSAGCVLANRLSEIKEWKILLIEAGGNEDAISDVPMLMTFLRKTEKDWNYTTVNQRKACLRTGGICDYPRGHVMGGSSTINAMIYVRGNKADFDGWAEVGNVGWNYENVLPYFIKSENNTNPELVDLDYHGYNGYLNVQHAKYSSKLESKFISAGKEFGWQEGDYNGKAQDVIGSVQYTIDGPSRESTSKAYLNPIRMRKNLHILKNAIVSRVIIDGNIAKGVEYYRKGNKYVVLVRKEVILSAGAIDSPKLLMLSGIGPMNELKKHKIHVLANLPVGQQLEDHMLLPLCFKINQNLTISPNIWKSKDSIESYAIDKDGPLTTMGAEAMVFLNVFNSTEPPNLQIILTSHDLAHNTPYFTLVLSNLNPQSKGSVTLKSNDWRDPPLIDPNYFNEEIDFKVFEEGFKLSLEYIKTPTMEKLSPKLFTKLYPDCEMSSNSEINIEFIKCIIHFYSRTIYHPVATAKMGTSSDKNSVVTPDLLVKGFKNLRVIDASIMPSITRGNTIAPTIMIAEKGADLVKSQNAIF